MLIYLRLGRPNLNFKDTVRQNLPKKEQDDMMPLIFAAIGEENIIKKIGGKSETKQHLEDLGFVIGGRVNIISAIGGNLIVNVKDSRVAISKEMASKIFV